MTHRERMVAGDPYLRTDPELVAARHKAKKICRLYSLTTEDDLDARQQLIHQLLGSFESPPEVESPLNVEYGFNIHVGLGLVVGARCTIMDCSLVRIGDGVVIGPNVQIYTATLSLDPDERASGYSVAMPIQIGSHVFVGGGAIIGPGVTIGEGATIGAGSVVVRDVPAFSVVAGNPARIKRSVARQPDWT